ncbi:MAG: Transcriptional regulator [Parcubacteria group bacterium Gr01-1014_18]|nr:MAG: Transcriptional regulator [Parcubacteria group bacterium Greene0416_36]TSC81160.1 MAG: Transcriptional regulator [Parcubacteria group bacterium Gr01-1014_18]TSC99157.1 MAG: Transcriptional regulator [Parcubacteria group bacterium Greene1014_20]TSD07485.1 MAG: Transcriptional regulator [Parcubacteria group bacterium Greene0714_2]
MSGHSKWHNIQVKKGAADAKRSSLFTKLSRNITMAAKELGKDLDTNFKLRMAVDKAKAMSMPKDTIEKAIKKGTGELNDGTVMEGVMYEVFGPEGSAILVETITDNRNRTLTNLKVIMSKNSGNLAAANSVSWMFVRRGVALVLTSAFDSMSADDRELFLIGAGAENIEYLEIDGAAHVKITVLVEDMNSFRAALEGKKIAIKEFNIEYIAKEKITISPSAMQSLGALLEALDNEDDVDNLYINVDFS